MARRLLAVAVLVQVMVANPATADAEAEEKTRTRFRTEFADFIWEDPQNPDVFGVVFADGEFDHLILQLQTVRRDPDGDVIGFINTYTDANLSPYGSLTIKKSLRSASLDVAGVPAQRCRFDASSELIGCIETTMEAHASWTGVGPISRRMSNEHEKADGSSFKRHSVVFKRKALGTVTINRMTFGPSDQILGVLLVGQGWAMCRLYPGCSTN